MKVRLYALAFLVAVNTAPGSAVAADEQPALPPPVDFSGDLQIPPPVQPAQPRRVYQPAPQIPTTAPTGELPESVIAWDSALKEITVRNGEHESHFKFLFTNVSPDVVTIHSVSTSCGCTTVQLPPMPWKVEPGTNSEINITMNVAGKTDMVFKDVNVMTDKGNKRLLVKTIISTEPAAMSGDERERNQKLALADRQAVFKGDCARCHSAPAAGKMGHELYVSACGICHDAEHRATMVPNLRMLARETNADYWKAMIVLGKPGTLMPAFSTNEGGPLTDEQITSLVDHLVQAIPSASATQAAIPAPAMNTTTH